MVVWGKHFALVMACGLLALIGVLTVWGTWGCPPPAVQAQRGTIRYVATTGTDTGSCTDPVYPCATVQYAVDQATASDEIRVATGIYTDVHQRAGITQTVYLSKTLTIQGGYTSTFAGPSDSAANPTTLDAQRQGRVLYIIGPISPTIAGLNITGGDAAGLGGYDEPWSYYDAGGGVYALTATITFRDNQVFSNTAEYYGGGLYLNECRATLSGNTIFTNTATFGGGVFISRGTATLSGNTVATNTAGYSGGGLHLSAVTATLNGNLITANVTERLGGGLSTGSGHVTLSGNTITANVARLSSEWLWSLGSAMPDDEPQPPVPPRPGGGGVYLGGDVTLNGNTIAANTAEIGGGVQLHFSRGMLINNLIVDNQAHVAGSGMYIEGSWPHLLHNTIARNRGGNGSGIYVTGYTLYPPWYGTIYSTVTLTNTILVSHTVGLTVTSGNTVTLEATLWGTSTWANGVDWGGAGTITGARNIWGDPVFVNPAGGDYHIGPDSAALDVGVNAGVWTDIDREPRLDQASDLGADEYWPPGVLRYLYLPLAFRDHAL